MIEAKASYFILRLTKTRDLSVLVTIINFILNMGEKNWKYLLSNTTVTFENGIKKQRLLS